LAATHKDVELICPGVGASHVENFRRALSNHHALKFRMNCRNVTIVTLSILLAGATYAANPFLDTPDDKPVSVNFRGTEWGDTIDEGEIPLTARVITMRIAKMPWGAIFKIEFVDLKSHAPEPRKIEPEYFIVTDDRIVLLNEENIPSAIQRISALDQPPKAEPDEIYGITSAKFSHQEGPWKTTIELKGDQCTYLSSHTSSGHFKKVVWKKGVGLVEYSMGYGAEADGYRLKRLDSKTP
jgi:hypothetical protein